jgi:hypothetical protein
MYATVSGAATFHATHSHTSFDKHLSCTHGYAEAHLPNAVPAAQAPAAAKASDALARAREVLRSMESRRGVRPGHIRSGTYDAADSSGYQRQGITRTVTDVGQMAALRRFAPTGGMPDGSPAEKMPYAVVEPATSADLGPQRLSALAQGNISGEVPQTHSSVIIHPAGGPIPLSGAQPISCPVAAQRPEGSPSCIPAALIQWLRFNMQEVVRAMRRWCSSCVDSCSGSRGGDQHRPAAG